MPPNGGATAPQGRLWSECPTGHVGIYGQRVVDVAEAAGVWVDTLRRIDRMDVATLHLRSLVKVAHAVGVTPVELVPGLGRRAAR